MPAHNKHSHVKDTKAAKKQDGSIDLGVAEHDALDAIAKFKDGTETLLDMWDNVLTDGSVITCFHHVAKK